MKGWLKKNNKCMISVYKITYLCNISLFYCFFVQKNWDA